MHHFSVLLCARCSLRSACFVFFSVLSSTLAERLVSRPRALCSAPSSAAMAAGGWLHSARARAGLGRIALALEKGWLREGRTSAAHKRCTHAAHTLHKRSTNAVQMQYKRCTNAAQTQYKRQWLVPRVAGTQGPRLGSLPAQRRPAAGDAALRPPSPAHTAAPASGRTALAARSLPLLHSLLSHLLCHCRPAGATRDRLCPLRFAWQGLQFARSCLLRSPLRLLPRDSAVVAHVPLRPLALLLRCSALRLLPRLSCDLSLTLFLSALDPCARGWWQARKAATPEGDKAPGEGVRNRLLRSFSRIPPHHSLFLSSLSSRPARLCRAGPRAPPPIRPLRGPGAGSPLTGTSAPKRPPWRGAQRPRGRRPCP